MKSAIAIIQARMSSTRLPGKVLMPLAGEPMIWHIYDRVRKCERVDKVVVATSDQPSDQPLVNYCNNNSIPCYRGNLDDVFSRYIDVLREFPHDYVVRITGDCPLVDPGFIDFQINTLDRYNADFIWLSAHVSVLIGQGVHSAKSLKYTFLRATDRLNKEHVGSAYFSKNPKEFKIIGVNPPENLLKIKMRIAVDEKKDYEFISTIFREVWTKDKPVSLKEAIRWYKNNLDQQAPNALIEDSLINKQVQAAERQLENFVSHWVPWPEQLKL